MRCMPTCTGTGLALATSAPGLSVAVTLACCFDAGGRLCSPSTASRNAGAARVPPSSLLHSSTPEYPQPPHTAEKHQCAHGAAADAPRPDRKSFRWFLVRWWSVGAKRQPAGWYAPCFGHICPRSRHIWSGMCCRYSLAKLGDCQYRPRRSAHADPCGCCSAQYSVVPWCSHAPLCREGTRGGSGWVGLPLPYSLDVHGASLVLVQMCTGRAQSRCRCGTG